MGNNNTTSDSSSSQPPSAKLDRNEAWAQLVVKYLRDLPRQLDGIRTVLESKDFAEIKNQAHRIRGTSGTYRLEAIAKSAAELERSADGQDPDTVATTINKIMRLVELETKRLNSQAVSPTGSSERNTNG